VGYDVLTAMSLKMTVFKDVVQCILVDIDRRYISAYCLMMAAGSYSETSVSISQTTQCNIPEDRQLQ